jgi:hypothetical protein
MPTARQGAASVVFNGQLWVIGGADSAGNVLGTVEVYNPMANAWTTEPPMPTARAGASASVIDGVIYVVGGNNSSGTIVATNEALTVGDGLTWATGASSIATINTNGLATGLSLGSSAISASADGISGNTLLTVDIKPTISINPINTTFSPGGTTILSVGANGGNLTYQWQLNGTNIAGATSSSYTLTNLDSSQVGTYTVIVGNVAGTTTSSAAFLSLFSLKMYAGLTIVGQIGANYEIDYQNSLSGTGWTVLTNIVLSTSPYFYVDMSSPVSSSRFYRALKQ